MKTIRQLRTERGWAQLDLAVRLGTTAGTVCAWERGRRVPSRLHRAALVHVFGINPTELALADPTPAPTATRSRRGRSGPPAPA